MASKKNKMVNSFRVTEEVYNKISELQKHYEDSVGIPFTKGQVISLAVKQHYEANLNKVRSEEVE
jgi:hypothetical protein